MDSLFFYVSKLIRPLLYPSTWLIVLALIALVGHRLPWRWVAKAATGTLMALVLVFGLFPIGQWLAYPLESRFTPPAAEANAPDGIIVLGGAWRADIAEQWGSWQLNHAAERDATLVALSRRYPTARLVFTGGSGRALSAAPAEASVAEQFYQDLGVDLSRLTFESQSRNTYENAVLSYQLINPNPDETWWLVTSAYHMPRSVEVFAKVGWKVIPYPVDYFFTGFRWQPRWAFSDHLWELEKVVQEWVGLWVYRLTGKA